jgi:hypothetical protein
MVFRLLHPRGGTNELKLSDDNELSFAILSCIADNEQYLVKNTKIKNLIFSLVKEKLKNESLVLTPNMIRVLALKLINEDQTLIVKIGNVILSSTNRVRLLTRLSGTAVIALLGGIFSLFPYAIVMVLIYFDQTENCGFNCNAYFKYLSKDLPVAIYAEESVGHLVIAENNNARQVEIYIPSKSPDKVIHTTTGERLVTKSYKPARKKAKEVTFSEFKKNDPVLSQFKDLLEPDIPQKSCPINDIDNNFLES